MKKAIVKILVALMLGVFAAGTLAQSVGSVYAAGQTTEQANEKQDSGDQNDKGHGGHTH